jgi:hypothetical protein
MSFPSRRVVVTLGPGRGKGRGLLCHEALLEHLEDLLRFREGQAEVFNALAELLQDYHIGAGCLVAIVSHTTSWTLSFIGAVIHSG